jgi:DNA-binding response OmpR family regulator
MSSRRVLLVEDEPGLVMTLTDRLIAEGYEVESAGDAVNGLARATAEPFDAILLDVMLPGGNGFDVCRTLRQRGIHTPILILTARGQVVDKVVGLELGAGELKLLKYFVERRGAALSRDELLNEVWGYNAMPSTRTVDVHVAWLRQKVEDNPRHPQFILTVHGLGYKFVG